MRPHSTSTFVSSLLLTVSLLAIGQPQLKFAATWPTRRWMLDDRIGLPNFQAAMALASLALVIIGLIVLWTGYQKRMRSSWFIMVIFVFVYFMPVNLIDIFLDMRRMGWPWWSAVLHEAKQGRQISVDTIYALAVFAVMVSALLLPIRAFFGKSQAGGAPDGNRQPTNA